MDAPDDVTGPINLGNPNEFTIVELAAKVIDLTGSRSCIVYRAKPPDDPRHRRPDISRAEDELGWAPRTPLHEGLMRTIAYFEDLLTDEGIKPLIARENTSLAIARSAQKARAFTS